MDIVAPVAAATPTGLSYRGFRRRRVTILAGEVFVSTLETEAGLLSVIENPEAPGIRRMALLTVSAQPPVMVIIPFVA